MKKFFSKVCIAIFMCFSAITVFAWYNFGPNNIFRFDSDAGTNVLKGRWVEGTMSRGTAEADKYYKMVYARSGAGGTYSDWKSKSTLSVMHRDYGSFSDDYAETHGHWDNDSDHTVYDQK